MNKIHQYELVAQKILELITAKGFEKGTRLPAERALAEQFHVSRTCVREAIRTLSESGVVSSRRGAGTYYQGTDVKSAASQLGTAVSKHRAFLEEIFELRQLLEPQIAALAAKRISPDMLEALKASVYDQQRIVMEQKDDFEEDAHFHRLLAEATDNRAVLEVLDAAQELLDGTRNAPFRNELRGLTSVKGHMRIVNAIENGDSETARKAMEQHIAEIEAKTFD